jgi:hypothetical protein
MSEDMLAMMRKPKKLRDPYTASRMAHALGLRTGLIFFAKARKITGGILMPVPRNSEEVPAHSQLSRSVTFAGTETGRAARQRFGEEKLHGT